jgi:hypothetical protein
VQAFATWGASSTVMTSRLVELRRRRFM